MDLNATMLGQMLTFAIFVWFTMKYIWPMLMEKMQERKKYIADGIAKAEQGQKILDDAKEKAEQEIMEAKDKVKKMLAEANSEANRIIEQSRMDAMSERENIIESGHSYVKLAVSKAKTELMGEIASLVVSGAEKIIMQKIDPAEYKDDLDKLIKTL